MRATLLSAMAAALVGCQAGAGAGDGQAAGDDGSDGSPATVEARRADDTLVGPFVHANLAVYLVVNETVQDEREFITLDEGLSSGAVQISEQGGSEGEDNSEVNTLEVSNTSKCWLYIEAGEVVKGGKQDRTMGRDLLVAPGTKNQPLAAFCVEQGRWSAGGAAAMAVDGVQVQSRGGIPNPTGPTGPTNNNDAPTGPAGPTAPSVAGAAGLAFMGASANLSPAAKVAILKEKSQQGVWDEVAKLRNDNDADESASGTFMDVVSNEKVQDRVQPYLNELAAIVGDRSGVIGCIICVDGEVTAADIYGAPGLFERLYPKVLAAHAREAALTANPEAATPAAPSVEAAIAFLDTAAEGDASQVYAGRGMEMGACENDETIAFESRANGKRMHYTALKK